MLAGKSISENIEAKKARNKVILIRPDPMHDTTAEGNGHDINDTTRGVAEADYTMELLEIQDLNEIVTHVQTIVKEDLKERRHKEVRNGILQNKKTREMCKKVL